MDRKFEHFLLAHEMAPMRNFFILQKWSRMAEMTPDDLHDLGPK